MRSKSYRAEYTPATIAGERGWWFKLFAGARMVTEGWTRGRKRAAEAEVRQAIDAREALRGAAGLA